MTTRAARTATPEPAAALSDPAALTGIAAILTDPSCAVGMLEGHRGAV